jgi:hypothetical protein
LPKIGRVSAYLPWRIAGAYLESCNCDAICPCRTIGGVPGGRSTRGVCFGVLCWRIDEGRAGELDLDGLNAALVYRYSDDEDGSPWQFVLHVDAHGDEQQRDALSKILVGRLGGQLVLALPWVRKPSELLRVRASRIEIEHDAGAHSLRVGESVRLRVSRPVETADRVSSIVPGHHQPGREHYADKLAVSDGPFSWELAGNCAFVSVFDYSSEDR